MRKTIAVLAAALLVSGTALAAETVSFTNVPSQSAAGIMSYDATLTGGYTLGTIDWSGFAETINDATYGSELRADLSGPLGSGTLTLGIGTGYAPGASFTGSSGLFDGAGDPAGVWTFDFYESFDDGSDDLPDANWTNIEFSFNDFIEPPDYILFEDFEAGIPATWSSVDNIGTSAFTWESSSITGRTNETGGSGECANADSDAYNNGGGDYDTSLITETFTIPADGMLEFKARHRVLGSVFQAILHADSGDQMLIDDTIGFSGTLFSYDLSALAGEEAYVEFRYAGDSWDWYAQVDDFGLTPEPTSILLIAVAGLILRRR